MIVGSLRECKENRKNVGSACAAFAFSYVDRGTAYNPPRTVLLRLTISSVCKDCHQQAIIDKVSELEPNEDVQAKEKG